ncbi:Gfo/Idh/MocA family protein [Salinisphaera sp. Q1T1-3]|uniref:Gfo/Idh/MocA family protein n=1 Tax=Salinisphaera sp. Q1T1-3 TaxID=2321229 RepID=UPI000E73CA29|nr:Gfo/Idh/MocA family oxidoreductase [Salinisphaera sp. Q1T1-3]RJS93341.1 gfo/Idh/MocA family oxidoreductase [Salinisphaera sp. Q1T1-3]
MKIVAIGAGAWGKNIIRNLEALGALSGIVEGNNERLNAYAEGHPALALHADWRAALDSDCDAVAIATPTASHYEIASAALAAGKDVFVEKPITHCSREARALADMARERGRILMVGHLLLYQPAIAWMKDYVEAGHLGELFSVRHERLNLGRARSAENVIWDIGVHDMAIMLYLIGSAPARVRGTGHRMLGLSVEDEVHVHLEFAGGIRGNLHTSWLWPETNRRTILRGSGGMLVYDEVAQVVTLHRKWIDAELQNHDEGSEVVHRGDGQPLRLELAHFIDCVTHRRRPRSDGESAVTVIETLERINEAVAESSRYP